MRLAFIDDFLNSITMYRLVLYGLVVLAFISLVFGFFEILPFDFLQQSLILVLVIAVCYLANVIFVKIFRAQANDESYLITALILFFILAPSTQLNDLMIVALAGILAMGSKFLLAVDKKHIFNPAGISVFILSLFGFGNIIWWVGSGVLLPFVVVFGLLVVRKLRKFEMVTVFFAVALVLICSFNMRNGLTFYQSFMQAFVSWPLVFFATIMLTEPLTLPPRKRLQLIYGGVAGFFFGMQFSIGPLFASPELAIVAANVFSYIVGSKQKLFTTLKSQLEIGHNMYEFAFAKIPFVYLPGQYLEWTLPGVALDSRGNRRYFTIASSPTEDKVLLGVKIILEGSSAYKKRLKALKPGDKIIGAQLTGDFVLPTDKTKKLIFIAGGIGVTPFRSMTKYLVDKKELRDIALFYCASDSREFVYQDIFEQGRAIGLKAIYVVTDKENVPERWNGEVGRITSEIIKKHVPDFAERTFYLSGPNSMVEGYKRLLSGMGVKRSQIVTDYFPGF